MINTQQKYNDVIAGLEKIKADRQGALSAQNSLNATEEQYQTGTSTILDVLLARLQHMQ